MKTKSTSRVWSLGLLFFVPLMFLACNRQTEVTSPEQSLIDKLNGRFEDKNYLATHSLINPYDQLGKDVVEFHQKLSSEFQPGKQIKNNSSQQSKVVYAGIFHFTSSNKEMWGIENPTHLKLAHSKIQEFYQKTGKNFDPTRLNAINTKFKTYSKDHTGVNDLLEDALSDKAINNTQNTILKSTLDQISKAKDIKEAISINASVEYEVLSSKINENDKAIILSVTSILKHSFKNQSRLPSQEPVEETIYKKTAVVIPILIVAAIVAAAGAVAGGAVGSASCCIFQGNCTWDCIGPYVRDGALAALAAEYIYQ